MISTNELIVMAVLTLFAAVAVLNDARSRK